MTESRAVKVSRIVESKGFIFAEPASSKKPIRNRITIKVSKGDQEFALYFISQVDEIAQNCLLKEIAVLKKLGEVDTLELFPKVIAYSDKDYWLIREKIIGKISGNVYEFSSTFSQSPNLISVLSLALKELRKIKSFPEIVDHLSAQSLISNLSSIEEKGYLKKEILEPLIKLIEKNQNKIDNKDQVLLHGDLQPTNIIIKNESEIGLIDFEKTAVGNLYYDVASIAHRFFSVPEREEEFISLITRDLKSEGIIFDREIFDLYSCYFLVLDIVSLDLVYIKKKIEHYHDTFLQPSAAKKMMVGYLERYYSIIKLLKI